MKLIIILLIIGACSTPITVTKPAGQAGPKEYSFKWNDKAIISKDSYQWKKIVPKLKQDNIKYTEWLVQEIKNSGLGKIVPRDASNFGYKKGMDLVDFWGNILVEMAFWEGGWDTDSFLQRELWRCSR